MEAIGPGGVKTDPVAYVGLVGWVVLKAGDLVVDVIEPGLSRFVGAGVNLGADGHGLQRPKDLGAVHKADPVAGYVHVDPVAGLGNRGVDRGGVRGRDVGCSRRTIVRLGLRLATDRRAGSRLD